MWRSTTIGAGLIGGSSSAWIRIPTGRPWTWIAATWYGGTCLPAGCAATRSRPHSTRPRRGGDGPEARLAHWPAGIVADGSIQTAPDANGPAPDRHVGWTAVRHAFARACGTGDPGRGRACPRGRSDSRGRGPSRGASYDRRPGRARREPVHEDGHAPTVGGAIQVEHGIRFYPFAPEFRISPGGAPNPSVSSGAPPDMEDDGRGNGKRINRGGMLEKRTDTNIRIPFTASGAVRGHRGDVRYGLSLIHI